MTLASGVCRPPGRSPARPAASSYIRRGSKISAANMVRITKLGSQQPFDHPSPLSRSNGTTRRRRELAGRHFRDTRAYRARTRSRTAPMPAREMPGSSKLPAADGPSTRKVRVGNANSTPISLARSIICKRISSRSLSSAA